MAGTGAPGRCCSGPRHPGRSLPHQWWQSTCNVYHRRRTQPARRRSKLGPFPLKSQLRRLVAMAMVAMLAGCAQDGSSTVGNPLSEFCAASPTDSTRTVLVAAADLIVLASLEVPVVAPGTSAYVRVGLRDVEPLKGRLPSTEASVMVYLSDGRPGTRTLSDLMQQAGRRAMVFLVRVDAPRPEFYLPHGPSLAPASDSLTSSIRQEVLRQDRYLGAWTPDLRAAGHARVRSLLDELGSLGERNLPRDLAKSRQDEVFRELEELGETAVTAMIAAMDDRRPLAVPSISLVNKSKDSFEGLRHYAPRQIVDAMSAILSQITGAPLSRTVNGGSVRERDAEVASWRIYDADRRCRGR